MGALRGGGASVRDPKEETALRFEAKSCLQIDLAAFNLLSREK
jgi:hypothetical protein